MKEELKEKTAAAQSAVALTAKSKRKKKYQKPSLVYQAPLEAMAATCTTFPGKATGICGTGFS